MKRLSVQIQDISGCALIRTSKKDRIGLFAREQAALLIISTALLILAAIALVNLERPPVIADKTTPVAASGTPRSETAKPRLISPRPDVLPPTSIEPITPVAPVATAGPDIEVLKTKNLMVPVEGKSASELRDSFADARSEGRSHQAMDIMAAAGTPVLAVTDGSVMKLWQSAKGGISLYQSDSTGQFVYFYAHLQRYADGITEGKTVRRGEVIAYVGDTGNAGAGNYHLHFAIYRPTAPGKWSGGIPINPYTVFRNQ